MAWGGFGGATALAELLESARWPRGPPARIPAAPRGATSRRARAASIERRGALAPGKGARPPRGEDELDNKARERRPRARSRSLARTHARAHAHLRPAAEAGGSGERARARPRERFGRRQGRRAARQSPPACETSSGRRERELAAARRRGLAMPVEEPPLCAGLGERSSPPAPSRAVPEQRASSSCSHGVARPRMKQSRSCSISKMARLMTSVDARPRRSRGPHSVQPSRESQPARPT